MMDLHSQTKQWNSKTIHGFVLHYIRAFSLHWASIQQLIKHLLGINTSQSWHIALAPFSIYKMKSTWCPLCSAKAWIPLLHILVKVQNKALKVQNGAIMARCLSAAISEIDWFLLKSNSTVSPKGNKINSKFIEMFQNHRRHLLYLI